MTVSARRKFRREGEGRRRRDLIEATLDCVAENGIEGATVRAIALRAGVSAGLIRHYFPGKAELLQAAYAAVVKRMTDQAKDALAAREARPAERLAAFVRANLGPPVVDTRIFALWAGFIARAHADTALAAVHREGYLGFRDEVESLVGAVLEEAGHPADATTLRRHAIAINAIIDGLWIEGCMASSLFDEGELAGIAIASVAAQLGVDLPGPAGRERA
ncbi:MAG: TetR family transcriptional regulator C-terminal domain-containing protein [Nitratireductor sp.]|jgi:AcrR family transcriptional regulator